jgi:hypothetical protein
VYFKVTMICNIIATLVIYDLKYDIIGTLKVYFKYMFKVQTNVERVVYEYSFRNR